MSILLFFFFLLSLCNLVLYTNISLWTRHISSVQYPHVASGYCTGEVHLESDLKQSQSFSTS